MHFNNTVIILLRIVPEAENTCKTCSMQAIQTRLCANTARWLQYDGSTRPILLRNTSDIDRALRPGTGHLLRFAIRGAMNVRDTEIYQTRYEP